MLPNPFETATRLSNSPRGALKCGAMVWLCLLLPLVASGQVRPHRVRLTDAEFFSLSERCAPGVPTDTMLAIARTESALNANALSINHPNAEAWRAGYSRGQLALTRQPKDQTEAIHWIRWFAAHGYTVSVGLMQVNVETARHYGVRADELLEPCTNLRVGARILIVAYSTVARDLGDGLAALDAALSLYNTGNPTAGVRNGYVADVYAHAPGR
jgi:type IV secretion system protein VirB1